MGAGCRASRAVRRQVDSRAGDVLGFLRDAHRRAAREPAARRRRHDAARSQARAAAGPDGPELTSWLSTKPDTVTITRDGKEVTLTGEALARWKYQRYMQDYLATMQSVDDNVGRLLGFLDTAGLAQEHDGHLHERSGLLPRRPRAVRQAVHVRGVAADAVPRALAGGDQGRVTQRRDGAERGFRADVSRRRRRQSSRGDAGPQPAAGAARQGPRRLADVDVLPLLPRSGRPQHARALRRAHGDAQADLFLEEGSVGAVRPGERSATSSTTCTASRARRS